MKTPRITVTPIEGLPDGWFNAAALERADGRYILVARDQNDQLHGGILDERLRPASAFQPLRVNGNIDPRLTRWGGRAYMSTRYYGDWDRWRIELWPITEDGLIDHHDEAWKHTRFMTIHDWPEYTPRRENNWAPFLATDDELHYVHEFSPHRVLWYNRGAKVVHRVTEEPVRVPSWGIAHQSEFRLNTNPVRLQDGTMLSTIHAKSYDGGNCYYTGFYTFQGEKPYRVLRVSPRPVIGPEHCVGNKQYRPVEANAVFPLSLHLKDDLVMMIGGSSSACCVVIRARLQDVLDSLVSAS